MGAQVCAQVAPTCVQVPHHPEWLSYWARPTRAGMGREDFCYSYTVPPPQPEFSDEETDVERYEERQPNQYFITEGKLSFHVYTAMVKALHEGRLFAAGVLEKYCQESWLGYDPYPEDDNDSKTDN